MLNISANDLYVGAVVLIGTHLETVESLRRQPLKTMASSSIRGAPVSAPPASAMSWVRSTRSRIAAASRRSCRVAGEDYETFAIELDPEFEDERGFTYSFCKTGGVRPKPYDMAVTAAMLRAHTLAPDCFAIDSDGDWDQEWVHARAIHRMLFGTDPGMESPFTSPLHTIGPVAARY
ncbi:hypothetical protein [Streptomyces sp. NPDC057552]|uniref:hypothetical protein n=1 Tax=Streptomyces sp. NPDC057552 TaxID=3350537 RepID=UPI0036AE140D